MSLTNRVTRARLFRFQAGGLMLLIVVSWVGCSESNPLGEQTFYPVKGRALLADGKPLTSGQVIFVATKSTITSTANIESDGGFTFKGLAGDGLPAGEYKVRIEAGSSGSVVKGPGRAPIAKLPFDGKYTDEDLSELTAIVTTDESKNNFEFKLVPGKSSAQSKDTPASRGDR
ncbi:MAG: carboxypeptidase-like regulatory domain-containing protein [Isosphaeraceae bacterium]